VRRLRNIYLLALALHGIPAFADSLTDRVLAAFNQQDPKLQATAKSDDEIHLTTSIGPLTVYLDRVRGECRKRPDDCGATVAQLVTATLATSSSPDSMKFDPEQLYPVVRPLTGLQAMQATIGGDITRPFVSRPWPLGWTTQRRLPH
jgi:hypothetical protein